MPTKKETNSSSQTQYNQAGMSAYNTMTPQMSQIMQMYMSNPLTASYFQNQLGMANKQIGQQGQSQMMTLMNNARQFGSQGNNPFLQSQMAMQGRATSANQGNAFNQLLMGAEGNRRWAAGASSGYSPLATGATGKSTEQTSGLGTWLPQLAGAAIGGISSAFTGGASGALGGFGGAVASTPRPGSPFTGALGLQGSPSPSLVNPFLQ